MTVATISLTWAPLPWLAIGAALAAVCIYLYGRGERQLATARERLSLGETRSGEHSLTTVAPAPTVTIGPWRSDAIRRWALEDGDRPPGADERAARAATRPRPAGLAEVIPLRRHQDGAA